MKRIAAVMLVAALFGGCASSGAGSGVSAVLPASQSVTSGAGIAAQAALSGGFTEMYIPVSVGVSYVMPFDDLLTETVGFDIGYTWRKDYNWDVELTLGYVRYEWENGATKSQTLPLMVTVRYSELMLSGATWYTGIGLGYSLNDSVDLDNSIAAKVVVGITQPMNSDRVLVGLEAAYYYSEAERKWGGGDLDLSSLQGRINFIYNF